MYWSMVYQLIFHLMKQIHSLVGIGSGIDKWVFDDN